MGKRSIKTKICNMVLLIQKIINIVLDFLFPSYCIFCKKNYGNVICKDCENHKKKGIIFKINQVCPICKKSSIAGKVCKYCKNKTNLDGLFVAIKRSEFAKIIIHELKYNFIYKSATQKVSQIILDAIVLDKKISKILKKETHATFVADFQGKIGLKKEKRNFNHSEMIAKIICNEFQNINLQKLLKRKKGGPKQAQLKTRKERIMNVKNVFFTINNAKGNNKSIILFDDVATTLATLENCAKALKKAGFSRVFCICFFRD